MQKWYTNKILFEHANLHNDCLGLLGICYVSNQAVGTYVF